MSSAMLELPVTAEAQLDRSLTQSPAGPIAVRQTCSCCTIMSSCPHDFMGIYCFGCINFRETMIHFTAENINQCGIVFISVVALTFTHSLGSEPTINCMKPKASSKMERLTYTIET